MNDFFNSILLSNFGWEDPNLKHRSIGGGCISNNAHLSTNQGEFFLKWKRGALDMFQKEELGLNKLLATNSLNIPKVYASGKQDGLGYLLMDFIPKGPQSNSYWEALGEGLSQLHRNTSSTFGLDHNNYIGELNQDNTHKSNHTDFFVENRLEPQLKLARNAALIDEKLLSQFENLHKKLIDLIPKEEPALLHGDLWSGNIHYGAESSAFLIDPAIYYGHREADLAMTRLFGGFDLKFYESYQNSFPLEPEYESRVELFNLYPLLVHLNLFGSSYLSGILSTLRRYA
ncbi:MAG: fructosamine kinase family protein [Cyclobacteriaceae bacterium]